MEKNTILIFNNLIYDLYSCTTIEAICTQSLEKLRMLIPFSYASILPSDSSLPPLCIPESFAEAEINYRKYKEEDPLGWMLQGSEPELIKESDLWSDDARLNSSLYKHCFSKFKVYDSIQYSIVYNHTQKAILSLYRTKNDKPFTQDDLFYMRAIGLHLNRIFYQIYENNTAKSAHDFLPPKEIAQQYHLTSRELQVLECVLLHMQNTEIAEKLQICENTLQKHLQNIYRKTGSNSKWDLFHLK